MDKRGIARSRWSGLGQRAVVVVASAALLGSLAVAAGGRSAAQTLPSCGGQNAAPQPVPYTCSTPVRTIDGSQVSAVLRADGQTVTVTYTLVAPRTTDAAVRITHHSGISGGGGPRSVADGVIPAGQTTATLAVTTPCVAGQIDIKFVFVLDSQPEGRVGGPWIQNGTPPCTPPTTPAPGSTTTVPPASTVPPTSTAPIFIGAVGTTCQRDVPVIVIRFGNRTDLDGHPGTLTFVDLNGKTIETRPITYQANGTVTELYPGAAVDAQGNAADWPGWKLNEFGFWVEDPTDALWRDGLTLTVSVNPTASTDISYPPASSACASPSSVSQRSTLPPTGSSVRDASSVALVAVVVGSLLILVFGARRRAAQGGDS
jgi:hypothetical protein